MRAQIIKEIETWDASAPNDAWDDDTFNALALSLFAWQFEHNEAYGRYCRRQRCTPETLTDYRDIPAVPTDVFKAMRLSCWPTATQVFRTSGTTQGQRGEHWMGSTQTYLASMFEPFKRLCLPDGLTMPFLVLAPDSATLPDSSLSFMLSHLVSRYASPEHSRFFFERDPALPPTTPPQFKLAELAQTLDELCAQRRPAFLLGTAFAFVELFDHPSTIDRRWALPPGSRLLETGGFKGRTGEVSKAQLYALFEERLGIPSSHCVSEYSMTELSAQAYTDNLYVAHHHPDQPTTLEHRRLRTPPWARVEVVDPLTLKVITAPDARGLLCWYDLSNTESVLAVQTSDVGYKDATGGVVLLGRAQGAELRGCSLTIEEILSQAPTQ